MVMSSLYELNAKLASYQMEFDPDTGEWINEDELDALNMKKDEKIENLLLWAKNLRAESKAIKEEENILKERRKSKDKQADNIEDYVALNLDGQKFETARVKVNWRKTESVEITNADAVPERFLKNEVVKTPMKDEIKKYLKICEAEGKEMPWAKIKRRLSMSIK